jgi:hypothetical protein
MFMKNSFKLLAKQHQINYRDKKIENSYNTYPTWLTDEKAIDGKNFYDGFSIFDVVKKRYPKFYIDLYSDMLRSEHIPFNFFVPLRYDLTFCKNIFNEFLGACIKSIDNHCLIDNEENIKIEFAPKPSKLYLNDKTSFDTYIEYTHIDNSKGIIGIEVKYTEQEYKLEPGSKQEIDIKNKKSIYYTVSKDSNIYKQSAIDVLPTDIYRQIWRNQLLGESMLLTHPEKFKHFTSLIIFPKDNTHFVETGLNYTNLLIQNKNNFLPISFEIFLLNCYRFCPNNDFKKWIDYLTERYIIH